MAKVIKKVVKATVKVAKVAKKQVVTAASIVLGLLRMKDVPCDADIIAAVHIGVEETKFDKTQLAWYKYQYRQGRWNDGEAQVINQPAKVKAEKPAKVAKVAKKASKKVVEVDETEEESED